jgi:hypothetical protein
MMPLLVEKQLLKQVRKSSGVVDLPLDCCNEAKQHQVPWSCTIDRQ